MNKNDTLDHTEPKEKSPAHFKFSLFSASSDVWILAIALLILLLISFIKDGRACPASFKQEQGRSENNVSSKNTLNGMYVFATENNSATMGKKNMGAKALKIFLG